MHLKRLALGLIWSLTAAACSSVLGIQDKHLVTTACAPGTPANDAQRKCANVDFEDLAEGPDDASSFGFFCASLPEGSCARRVSAVAGNHVIESRLRTLEAAVQCKQVIEDSLLAPESIEVSFDLEPPERASVHWFGLFSAESGQKEIALGSDGSNTQLRLGQSLETLSGAPVQGARTQVRILIHNARGTLDLFYDGARACPSGGGPECQFSAQLGQIDISNGEWSVQLGVEDKDGRACEPSLATYDNYVRVFD